VSSEATYTYGHSPGVVAVHAARSAQREAGFILGYLATGMRVLDAGCGPGSITVGLAEHVAPGEVVGIDRSPDVIEQAQRLASERGVTNARFQTASVTSLPFDDASFDAVFAHTLLEHVRDPLAALREFSRVLKPGGTIGVRDADWQARSMGPFNSDVEEAADLYARLWRHNGGDPRSGPKLPELMLEAGFQLVSTAGSFRWNGSREESRQFAVLLEYRLGVREMSDALIGLGWVSAERLAELRDACRRWSDRPDAFCAMLMVEAIGRR
jgi:ubiquinone/menaquinone biosynthesis C-methylase UbiE